MTDSGNRQDWVWNHFCRLVGRDDLSSEREMTLEEELNHSAGTARLAQLIAEKRHLNTELAFILGVLHDYGRVLTGTKNDHARIGSAYVQEYLTGSGGFSAEEVETLVTAAANHSLKDQKGSPLEEVIKDADVLDAYFSGRRAEKPEAEARLRDLFKEFSLI
jgi:uncharacterized protein